MIIGYLAALVTLLSWTVATYAFTHASRKANPASVNRVRLLYAFLLLSVLVMVIEQKNPLTLFGTITENQYLYFGISGFIGLTLGDYFAFTAFKILGNRRTSLFSCFAPSAAFIGAGLLRNEPITIQGILGMLVSVSGIMVLVLSRKEKALVNSEGHGNFGQGVLFGILGALCQGFGLVLAKMGFDASPQGFSPIYATWVRMFIAALSVYAIGAFKQNLITEFKLITLNKEVIRPVALGTLFGPIIGVSFSLLAATNLSTGVAQTLFSMLPISVMLAAVWIYKEKVNWLAYLAVIISLTGVMILVWQ